MTLLPSLRQMLWLAGVLCVLSTVSLWTLPARAEGISVGEDPDDTAAPASAPADKENTHSRRADHRKARTEEAPPKENPPTPPTVEKPAEATAAPAAAPSVPTDLGTTTTATPQNAVALPTDSWATLIDHWHKRERFLTNGDQKRVEEEEHEVERIKKDLALENMLTCSAGLLLEADNAFKAHHPADALEKCEEARKLSPDLNLADLCVARATFGKSFADVQGVFSALNKSFSATWKDPRSRRNAFADWTLLLLLGFAVGCGVLLLLLIARYCRLFSHDFSHLFPQGVSQWQTIIVAVALIGMPVLIGGGLLGAVAMAAIAISLSLSRGEAIALAVAFVLLAGAQFTAGEVLQASAFGRAAQDVYLLERGDAPEAAAARLQSRHDKGLGEYATAFALGHYHKRMGQLSAAKEAYEAARKIRETPELLNNIGNVLFLLGDTEGARLKYNDSEAKNPGLAAPRWNLAKLYYREGKLEQGQKVVNEARAVDPNSEWIANWSSPELKANTYLADVALSDEEITHLADEEAAAIVTGSGATFPFLTGRASMGLAILIALLTAALVGAGQFLKTKIRASTHCEKCGRPVCSRCDPELGTGSAMCGQCISVFVRRTGVDAPDRVRKELEVRSFRRRHRLLVRAIGFIIGGGGHIFSGRIIGGAIFLALFGLLVGQVIFPHGILRSPVPVRLSVSAFYIALYVAGFALIYGLSIFHLIRHEEAD